MRPLDYQELGDGIYCVDTGLFRKKHTALYLIEQEGTLACIDNGSSNNIPALLLLIKQLGFRAEDMRYVMPTHVHLDHAGGSGALMAACPNAQLVIHPKGLPHMVEPSRLQQGTIAVYGEEAFVRTYGELKPIPEQRTHGASDDERFDLNGRMIRFIDTPGHANHHGCLFDEASTTLFTGDTYGLYYRELHGEGEMLISPTTPVAFDPEAWFTSLEKIAQLNPKRICPTHFGPIEEPLRLLDQLKENIAAHRDIALEEERQGGEEGRYDRLHAAVTEMQLESYRRYGSTASRERLLEAIGLDIDLNTQGLVVWLKRRAKTRG